MCREILKQPQAIAEDRKGRRQCSARVSQHLMDERFHLCLIENWLVGHDVSPFFITREPTGNFTGRLTLRLSRCRKRERGTSGRWRQSAAGGCSALSVGTDVCQAFCTGRVCEPSKAGATSAMNRGICSL